MPPPDVAKATFETSGVPKVAFATLARPSLRQIPRLRVSVVGDVAKASFPTLKVRKEAFTDITQPKAARSAGLPPATGSTSDVRFSSTETPAPGFGRSV